MSGATLRGRYEPGRDADLQRGVGGAREALVHGQRKGRLRLAPYPGAAKHGRRRVAKMLHLQEGCVAGEAREGERDDVPFSKSEGR